MKKKIHIASPDQLDPRLQRMMMEGLPATVDGDPVGDNVLLDLVRSFFSERMQLLIRCGDLYREWSKLPNVTLDQGCWLLLERDPFKMLDTSQHSADLSERFCRLKNRLELEIGESYKPLTPYISGIPRRFYLSDISRVAQAINIEVTTASVISEIASEGGEPVKSTVTAQRRRVDERMSFHRVIVDHLLKLSPPSAYSIPPKARHSARRKYTGQPINVEITGLHQGEYCALYRELFAKHKSRPGYNEPDNSLIDDCRALNVAFATGRPKGMKDKKKRRRVGKK